MLAHSPGIGLPYNVNEARQLLSETGDLDHWRDVFSRMDALLPSGSLVPYAHSLQAQWKEHLGIDIDWRILDPDACFNRLQNDIPPMYLIGWMPDCPDPGSLFPSSRVRQYTHWQSNRYDALLKEAKQTIDQTARARLYQEADRMLIQETVFVPLTYGRNLLLVKPWIKKLSTSPLTRWLWKDIVIEPH
jgi:ABC-type oligopeptide transport system substrate-binding subunit